MYTQLTALTDLSSSGAWCFVRPGERHLNIWAKYPSFPYKWEYCSVPSCASLENATRSDCRPQEASAARPPSDFSL